MITGLASGTFLLFSEYFSTFELENYKCRKGMDDACLKDFFIFFSPYGFQDTRDKFVSISMDCI